MNISETLALLLEAHGIRTVVVSPGSRNAPILTSMSRCKGLEVLTVVDERAAAFVALGIALTSLQPVAIVCTSGSAILNYAPALAEAYYRRIPLIVITADRPGQWINQNDSQTLVQPGALNAVVSKTVDVPPCNTAEGKWFANRIINEAILKAEKDKRPVHINVQLDFNSFGERIDYEESVRVVNMVEAPGLLPTKEIRALIAPMHSPSKVLIVAGFMPPDNLMNRAMARLAARPNVVVLAEAISNLHSPDLITTPDICFHNEMPDYLRPDFVISTGGAVVSAAVKRYLRNLPQSVPVWHVGREANLIDCYKHLTTVIDISPTPFFSQFASAMNKPGQPHSDYSAMWHARAMECKSALEKRISDAPGGTLAVMNSLVEMIPRNWNVHVSNGTAIRFLQLNDCTRLHRCECNRGVSGIDGTTMTALGASLEYKDSCTLLISGDMSLNYDLGWLTSSLLTPRFKIIVIDNDGGNIFRMINSTKNVECREQHFAVSSLPNLLPLAQTAGWRTFDVQDITEFREVFNDFSGEASAPAIMFVHTSAESDIKILTDYL